MRRILALLLAAVFCSSPFLFAVLDAAETNVPACCRRLGAHHCSMRAPVDAAGHQIGARCPHSGVRRPEALVNGSALTKPALVFGFEPASGYYSPRLSQPTRKSAVARSHQKRGPPFLLA